MYTCFGSSSLDSFSRNSITTTTFTSTSFTHVKDYYCEPAPFLIVAWTGFPVSADGKDTPLVLASVDTALPSRSFDSASHSHSVVPLSKIRPYFLELRIQVRSVLGLVTVPAELYIIPPVPIWGKMDPQGNQRMY
jgi:hypothetical protein